MNPLEWKPKGKIPTGRSEERRLDVFEEDLKTRRVEDWSVPFQDSPRKILRQRVQSNARRRISARQTTKYTPPPLYLQVTEFGLVRLYEWSVAKS